MNVNDAYMFIATNINIVLIYTNYMPIYGNSDVPGTVHVAYYLTFSNT